MPIPPQRDPERTARQLEGWLRDRLAGAHHVQVAPSGGPSSTGFSSDTFVFDAAWRDASGEHAEAFVARFEPTGFQVFPDADFERQYRAMRELGERTDIPVPRVWWYEPDAAVAGAPFLVMGRIDGRVPPDNPPYHMDGWLKAEPPERQRILWINGLEVLAAIHRLDWQALGLTCFPPVPAGRSGLDVQLDYYEGFFDWARAGREQPVVRRALDWLHAHAPGIDEQAPAALCWGDARIGNMIFDDALRVAAVLDWEMVGLGEPESDLAWWCYLDRHHWEAVGAPRLPGLPDRDETVARWEQAVGRAARRLDYYEAFAATRFAIIMIRLDRIMIDWEVVPADGSGLDAISIGLLDTVLGEVGA